MSIYQHLLKNQYNISTYFKTYLNKVIKNMKQRSRKKMINGINKLQCILKRVQKRVRVNCVCMYCTNNNIEPWYAKETNMVEKYKDKDKFKRREHNDSKRYIKHTEQKTPNV